jgi:pimeloyl-ACP methyl ester carboxylesterase
MIYGERDVVQEFDRLSEFVPDVEVARLDCGHWIHQEKPEETNRVILEWLGKQEAASR